MTKKVTKKKVAKKVKPEEFEVEQEKALSKQELNNIVDYDKKEDVLSLKIELEKSQSNILTLKKEILRLQSLNLEMKNEKILDQISKIETQKKDIQNRRKNYLVKLTEKHKIEGRWGFDPDTGKILTD